jgi:hypothetical protein
MPYLIRLSNGDIVADIPDGAVDSASTSLDLVGKNLSGYGTYQNTNFVRLLENFSNSIAPDSPVVGQIWYDSNKNKLKVYTSVLTSAIGVTPETFATEWKEIGNLNSGNTEPSIVTAKLGDMWYNTDTKSLYIFNGQIFDIVSTGIPGFARSRLEGSVVQGSINGAPPVNIPILNLYVDNSLIGIISKVNFIPSTTIPGLHVNSQTPGLITKGLTLSNDSIINGRAEQALKYVDPVDGALPTTSFLRTDKNSLQTVIGSVKILGNVGAGSISTSSMINFGNYNGSGSFSTLEDAIISFSGKKLILNQIESTTNRDILLFDGSNSEVIISPVASNVSLGTTIKKFKDIHAITVTSNVTGNLNGNVTGNLNGDHTRVDKLQTRDGLSTAVDLTKPTTEFYGKFIGDVSSSNLVGTNLTAQRLVFVGNNGKLIDDSKITFNGTNVTIDADLTVTEDVIINGTLTVTGGLSSETTGSHKGNVLASDNSVAYNHITKTFTGSLIGNASTASSFAVSRTINGVSFDGSSNITVEDNTKMPLTGGTITGDLAVSGNLVLSSTPTQNYHAVSKGYVDALVDSRPLVFSLDTKGLSTTGSGPGSVVEVLNALVPPANFPVNFQCRISSTIQNVGSTVTTDTRNFISITYVRSVSVTTTVANPTRNNNLIYRVNSSKTSWEYVSG